MLRVDLELGSNKVLAAHLVEGRMETNKDEKWCRSHHGRCSCPGATWCDRLRMDHSWLISQECYEVIFPGFPLKFRQYRKKYENSYQYQKPRLTAGICVDSLLIPKCIGVELRNIIGSQSMYFFFPKKKQIRNRAILKEERERVILYSFSGFS